MRKVRKGQVWQGCREEKSEPNGTWAEQKNRPGRKRPGRQDCTLLKLLLAGVVGKLFCPDYLAVQRAGNERLARRLSSLAVGDGDAIGFEGAPDGALVIGLGFGEVGQSAQFRALRVDEVALRLDDEVYGRSSERIPLLLRIKSLLLEFARLAGGIDLSAVLGECNVGVANVEHRGVLQLLQLRFQVTLSEDSALIVRLR